MTVLFPLASWSAADEATRMWLQAHLFHDVLWHMPGRDELGRRYTDVRARIVGINVRDRAVVFRSTDPRDRGACFGWDFRSAAFEWLEGRLVVEPRRCDAGLGVDMAYGLEAFGADLAGLAEDVLR